jgi:hypothetical protein
MDHVVSDAGLGYYFLIDLLSHEIYSPFVEKLKLFLTTLKSFIMIPAFEFFAVLFKNVSTTKCNRTTSLDEFNHAFLLMLFYTVLGNMS